MRTLASLAAILAAAALCVPPAAAQDVPEGYVLVKVTKRVTRHVVTPDQKIAGQTVAAFGPFRVLEDNRAALVGATDTRTPVQFAAMLTAYPAIDTLEFVDCPGTFDDHANLRLGRMIRAHGIAVVVPDGGSVRSGGVELALAGRSLSIADGAEFAVHAWEDDRGTGASGYAADSPEHAKYLAYYRDMGMDAAQARAFYAMTNAVPFERARWLNGAEMRGWVSYASAPVPAIAVRPDPVAAGML